MHRKNRLTHMRWRIRNEEDTKQAAATPTISSTFAPDGGTGASDTEDTMGAEEEPDGPQELEEEERL